MEQSKPPQHDQQVQLTQGIIFKTQIVSQAPFKITRKRSVSPLEIKDRTQSMHVKNVKEKHLIYKKDLLQQRFQNLQLNPKQQKKPLKLRLERVNKQNMMVLKQLGDISNGLQIKFQAQNCLIRRSLEKMERLVSRSTPQKMIQIVESSKKINQRQKLELGPTQNEKNLQAQIQNINEEKNKLQQEIKGMKSVNQFLSNENYKLSMQKSMLKQRIMEYEQNDYINALKSVKDSDSEDNQSIDESKKEETQQIMEEMNGKTQQQSQVKDRKLKVLQKVASQTEFPKKIASKKSQKSQEQCRPQMKKLTTSMIRNFSGRQPENTTVECMKCKKNTSASEEILRLVGQVKKLEQQLQQQRMMNETLSNKIALLKLQLSEKNQANKAQDFDSRMDSSISINMDIKKNQKLKQDQPPEVSEQSSDAIRQSQGTPEPSALTYPHKATKSNILSNQIIQFAEPIHQQKDKNPHKSSNKIQQMTPGKTKQPSQPTESVTVKIEEDNQDSENSEENKKTLCMKKLQMPCLEVEKKRKSMSEKLSNSMLTKGLNIGNNTLSFYSNQKVNQLQFIRETISLKFEAFKYTFELFQNQMILWPNGKLNIKEVKSILSEYPFFLDESSVETLLGYCGVVQSKDIKVDKFCNKIKQFVQEYEEMTEKEELILEKKIYKRWKYTKDEILEVMKKNETTAGEITKAKFVSVLEEFKFEEKQIHHLLSQSVAVSPDINRIQYRQYLANFLTKK